MAYAGSGSKAFFRFSDVLRLLSPDPKLSSRMKNLLVITILCIIAISTSHGEGHVSLKLTSPSGFKGWTLATAKHSQGEWMNSTLVIVTKAEVEKTFKASRAFIEVWGFADSDTAIVVRSRNSHGPSWIEKFDLVTGKVVAECQGSNNLKDTPKWAQSWCDESKTDPEEAEGPSRR